jgi:hypothetical protein
VKDPEAGSLSPGDPNTRLFLDHYERWRRVYAAADRAPRNQPDWKDGKLYLRENYPHQDWSGFALEQSPDGSVLLLTISTERRDTPHEAVKGVFSDVEIAGKYLILSIGDYLRINLRLDPVAWRLRDAGLSPEVEKVPIDDKQAKYMLRDAPTRYFTTGARGISWNNWLLTISYEQLNSELGQGFPEAAAAALRTDSVN